MRRYRPQGCIDRARQRHRECLIALHRRVTGDRYVDRLARHPWVEGQRPVCRRVVTPGHCCPIGRRIVHRHCLPRCRRQCHSYGSRRRCFTSARTRRTELHRRCRIIVCDRHRRTRWDPQRRPACQIGKVTVNVSFGSSRVSFVIGTENVLFAVPRCPERVPLVAV